MINSNPTILRCTQCGHSWKPRNTEGTARQCSKCRSRSIVEIPDEPAFQEAESQSNSLESGSTKSFSKNNTSIPKCPELKNDPDIIQKKKELELIRLDRQIAEERQKINESEVTKRLMRFNISLLNTLRSEDNLSGKDYDELTSMCIQCGAEGDKGLEYFEEMDEGGVWHSWYECRSCGVRIEC